MIATYFHSEELAYTGPELRPHFILTKFKIEGSALTAFIGPCHVKTDHLVDWEDRLMNDHIKAKSMLHFLGEFFGITLKEGVWIQRLIVSEICSRLLNRNIKVRREGDDLYVQHGKDLDRKLSVSIVTATPVSILLHLGIDIDAEGSPNQAIGLKDLNIDPVTLTTEILDWFKSEFTSVDRATTKVRPVI